MPESVVRRPSTVVRPTTGRPVGRRAAGKPGRSAQAATAPAAATLSESTPPAIGIRTTVSTAAIVRRLRPSPSVPRTRASRSGRGRGELVEGDRLLGEGEGRDVEPEVVQRPDPAGPRLDARPRHLEDRPHGDPDGPAVERVRAPRGHEHRVDAEGGGGPEHRPDVRVVDDVLEDEHPAGAGEDVLERRQRGAVHRGERPPVEVEAGELLDDVGRADEDGHAVPLGRRDDVPEVGEPTLRHEVRARPVPGPEGPPDHLLGLGDVEPALGLEPPPQRDVGEPDVVARAGGRRRRSTRSTLTGGAPAS